MSASCEIPRWQLLKQQLVNLSPKEFRTNLKADQDAVIVDVRTATEFREGSLAHALNIDYLSNSFLETVESLDRSKHYYLICRTGRRSVRTGILMKNWGFQHLVNLEGGLTAWQQEGQSLEHGD